MVTLVPDTSVMVNTSAWFASNVVEEMTISSPGIQSTVSTRVNWLLPGFTVVCRNVQVGDRGLPVRII